MALTFYTHPMSRGRIVRWLLEELGEPYETVVLDYGTTMRDPAYRALNPMTKVPTLVRDGDVVTETAAICTWVADAYPQSGLMPDDRASFYRWMFFAAGPVEQAVVNTSFGWAAPPDKQGRLGYGSLERVVTALTQHLTGRQYFVGDSFSAADIYAGSQIGWGLRFGTLPDHPVLRDYWAGLAARPALLRANALDDALMKKD